SRLDAVIANAPHLLGGAVRSAVFTLIAGGLLLLAATDRLGSRTTACALIVLMAADLWSIERIYWRFSPPATTLYASDPTIDYVKAQREPGAFPPFDPWPMQRAAANRARPRDSAGAGLRVPRSVSLWRRAHGAWRAAGARLPGQLHALLQRTY